MKVILYGEKSVAQMGSCCLQEIKHYTVSVMEYKKLFEKKKTHNIAFCKCWLNLFMDLALVE